MKRQTRALGFPVYGIRFLCFTSCGFILANHINLYITKTCCDKKKTSIGRYTQMRSSRSLYACTFTPLQLRKNRSGFMEHEYGSRSGWIKTQAYFLIEKAPSWTTRWNYNYIHMYIHSWPSYKASKLPEKPPALHKKHHSL